MYIAPGERKLNKYGYIRKCSTVFKLGSCKYNYQYNIFK